MGIEQEKGADSSVGSDSAAPEPSPRIRDFLKALRVGFKMAAIYRAEHPAFRDSVKELMANLESLFRILPSFRIGFTPQALFIDNRFWDDDRIYLELAQVFHIRKVKSLEFRPGITVDEMARFAAKLTLPMKDYIRNGGVGAILKAERIVHVGAEEVDYAQLLRGEGEEIKEVWPYLLMEAVEHNDPQKFSQLAESFEKVASKFNTEDLIQNEELQRHFARFFRYLKETAVEKYRSCARDLLKSLLAVRKAPPETKFEQLRLILSDLTEQDLASTLWEEIIGDDKFDSLSFSVFSKIISRDRHKKIASSLHGLFHADREVNRRAEVEHKLRLLLSGTSGLLLSDVYRQTLTSLMTEIPFEKKMELDAKELMRSYHRLLLNLLAREAGPEAESKILERLSEEWTAIVEDEDLDYLRSLWEVLGAGAGGRTDVQAFAALKERLADHLEGLILRGDDSPALDAFVGLLGQSRREAAVYRDKIYEDKTVSPTLLRAAFAFFPSFPADLKAGLDKHKSQLRLMERLADALGGLDSPLSLDILKALFRSGDKRLKPRAIKAMRGHREIDEPFLFGALEDKDEQVQGEALLCLAGRERACHVALAKLLNIQSPYGSRNRTLIKHIRLVERVDVRQAKPFLRALARRKDFWNRRVRQEARRVMEAWSEG